MLYLQRVMKNVTFIILLTYTQINIYKNQVEDTIDHTTEKKEYNANDNKQHKILYIIRLIYLKIKKKKQIKQKIK